MLGNTTIFLIINMLTAIPYALISPLLPTLGKEKDLSEGILGVIISLFPLAVSIFSTIVPILCKKYSRIKLLSLASFFISIVTILYGTLIYIPNRNLLIILVFILRIIHGICGAIISTLIYSLTISFAEKGKTQTSLGRLEIAFSLGSSAGLLISSVFYKIGGYPLPFFVAGFSSFFAFYLALQINDKNMKKDDEEKKDDDYNYLKYLKNPEIYSILIGFIVVMINITYFTPCLTNHLNNNYSISVSTASLIFMTPMIPYMIVMQFLDALTGKFGNYLVFIIGVTTLGVSSLMIYPVPPLPQSVIVIILGFLICGCGGVPVFIPGLVMLATNIKKSDKSIDEMSANDIATVLNTLCTEIGDFLGPLLGGYLSEKIGFKLCCLIISIIVLTYSAIFILFFNGKIKNEIKMIKQEKKSESKTDKNTEGETEHLKDN